MYKEQSKDTSGPAFPHAYVNVDGQTFKAVGMTRRQWLAGLAMLGEIANGYKTCTPEVPLSVRAHEIADRMLAFEKSESDASA